MAEDYEISLIGPAQLKTLEDNIFKRLSADTNKKINAWIEKQEEEQLAREAQFERHAQQVESFLWSIEKLIKARL